MPFDPSKWDSKSMSELCSDLSTEPLSNIEAALAMLERKVKGFSRTRLAFNLNGYNRDEFTELVRLGRGYGQGVVSPAVAAQFSFFQLFNLQPPGTRTLLVETATAGVAVASEVDFTLDSAQAGAASPVSRNLLAGGGAPQSFVTFGSAAAIPVVFHRALVPAGNSYRAPSGRGIVCELPPNTGISIWCATLNTALVAAFTWSEVDASWQR